MLTISRPMRIALGLFVLGFVSAALQLGDNAVLGAAVETVSVARNLASGHGFSNPYSILPTGPTALVPPVHPALMALVILLCGYGLEFATVLVLIQLVLYGIQVALMPIVSVRLLGQPRPGYFAAGVLILLPLIPIMPQFETGLHIVVLLLLVVIPVTAYSAIPSALLAALALHVNPSSLFLLAGWIFWKKPGFRWIATWACVLVLACLPWTIRNYTALGRFVFIRNNLPLELRLSNNDIAGAGFLGNLQSFRAFHPNNNLAEAESVRALGETAYFDHCGRQALDWIKSHPGNFLKLTGQRILLYWLPHTEPRPYQGWLIGLFTLMAIPAVIRLRRSPIFVSGFVLAPLLYYVVQADVRYRLPYLWLTLLAAGLTVSIVLERRTPLSAKPANHH